MYDDVPERQTKNKIKHGKLNATTSILQMAINKKKPTTVSIKYFENSQNKDAVEPIQWHSFMNDKNEIFDGFMVEFLFSIYKNELICSLNLTNESNLLYLI